MPPPLLAEAKTAHVNLMTDTIIANLPPAALRSVLRALLTTSPDYSTAFEAHARALLQRTPFVPAATLFAPRLTPAFSDVQARLRCDLGAGLTHSALALLTHVLHAAAVQLHFTSDDSATHEDDPELAMASIDGDIVQAVTAVQKTLVTPSGSRPLDATETALVQALLDALNAVRVAWAERNMEFVFDRSLILVSQLLAVPVTGLSAPSTTAPSPPSSASSVPIETFTLGSRTVPRLFSGLWQLSSPAWGVAPQSKIVQSFSRYTALGFTAYDMADHYGDAEIIFGRFRAAAGREHDVFAATKFCVFGPINVTPDVIRANVTERITRLHASSVDLLQFHWQDYSNPDGIPALKLLAADQRVKNLGLCNYDTPNMQAALDAGVPIVSNQVQFSLIDSRPTFAMASVCRQHGVKLLTYGTLCGGFLADKWLGAAAPDLFGGLTPSQRKYLEMIGIWGGWALFQELLTVLKRIGDKHGGVSVSTVAVRWVLDFDYVGAVIVGSRMGVSEHAQENLRAYGWTLDGDDQAAIEAVQQRSRRAQVFEAMGDCGAEYRA